MLRPSLFPAVAEESKAALRPITTSALLLDCDNTICIGHIPMALDARIEETEDLSIENKEKIPKSGECADWEARQFEYILTLLKEFHPFGDDINEPLAPFTAGSLTWAEVIALAIKNNIPVSIHSFTEYKHCLEKYLRHADCVGLSEDIANKVNINAWTPAKNPRIKNLHILQFFYLVNFQGFADAIDREAKESKISEANIRSWLSEGGPENEDLIKVTELFNNVAKGFKEQDLFLTATFVDDNDKNVQAAKELGLTTIKAIDRDPDARHLVACKKAVEEAIILKKTVQQDAREKEASATRSSSITLGGVSSC